MPGSLNLFGRPGKRASGTRASFIQSDNFAACPSSVGATPLVPLKFGVPIVRIVGVNRPLLQRYISLQEQQRSGSSR